MSLSFGYYHEQPADETFDPQLLHPLRALSECGVAVVVSAGNDSTDRPMFPAAFTPYPGGRITGYSADCVPLISVGALNPDRSIALFSNAGPWVTCHGPGAALVSTFPVSFDASGQAGFSVEVPGEGRRSTIDPDNFHSGFGIWSGTSFSAPILAGTLAQAMLDGECGPLDPTDPPHAISRAWAALSPADRSGPAMIDADAVPGDSRLARGGAVQRLSRRRRGARSGELVELLTPILWHTVRAQRVERDLAEDVVQTTWLALVRHAGSITEPQAVLQWLIVSARREAWRVVKRADASTRRTSRPTSWSTSGPGAARGAGAARRRTMSGCGSTSPSCRTAAAPCCG